MAWIYLSLKGLRASYRNISMIGISLGAIILISLAPTSLLRNPAYTWGGWLDDQSFVQARAVINSVPSGLMLAPYPLSGTVQMLDSNYPQMVFRNDALKYYLDLQNLDNDARTRIRTEEILTGETGDLTSLASLLRNYPEIRTIVFYSSAYSVNSSPIDSLLMANGFVHKDDILNAVVFWQ